MTPRTPLRTAIAALEKAATSPGGRGGAHLFLALARARCSSGDPSGTVEAALGAISAAATREEADAATSYLESLMERMAVNGRSILPVHLGPFALMLYRTYIS